MRNMSVSTRLIRGSLNPLAAAIAGILAMSAAQAQESSTDAALEEVIVFGRGETRQVQTITAEQLDVLPAGTSPLKAIENLPGVNFQSADPYGAYEWSARVTVRGFNQNQMGFTLDGVPLGDMTYGNHNGLHISRAIISENVGRVMLSQGTGSLDTASLSNLGGAVEFFSANPEQEFGVELAQMVGSDSALRTYASLNSGELGTGTRIMLSAVDASTEKWKGEGDQEQRMYNLKVVQPIGDATLTGYYNYSDRVEIDYQDLSYAIIERRGWDWDNWYSDWNSAVAAANDCAASGFSDSVSCDDAYWNAAGLRKDDLGYLKLDLPIGESVTWTTTGYIHQNEGQGLWGTPYTPTPGGAPLSMRTTEYDIDRKGVLSALTVTVGNHEISGGVWYETIEFNQARRFYGEPNAAAPTLDYTEFQKNPMLTQWEYDFDTDSLVLHLQDTIALTDAISLNVGFKSVESENEAETIVGDPKSGSIKADDSFLPQAGIRWSLNDQHELFAAYANNMKAFVGSGTSGPFSTSAAGFAAIRDVLEPETSQTFEAGWRFRGTGFEGLLAAYHVRFEDRQLSISQGPSIVGNPSVLVNVGNVETTGLEAALMWRPMQFLSWYTSAAWNDSEYADNYTVTSGAGVPTVVEVDGKQVVDAPELLLKSELAYDNGNFFARADVNFTDERYYTYLNDASADSYTLLNAGLGYRLRDLSFADELSIQAEVTNLTDKKYISTVGSAGLSNSDPNGTGQTLLRGAPRQYFLTVKAKF